MNTRPVLPARYNTLGFETQNPWAVDALRLVYNTPRLFTPLVEALTVRKPALPAALVTLTDIGILTYEPAHVFNTVTGQPVKAPSRVVPRYRLTSAGETLLTRVGEDSAVFSTTYPRSGLHNETALIIVLSALSRKHRTQPVGVSTAALTQVSGLNVSTVKWWLRRWQRDGVVTVLPVKIADDRELIPGHWRINAAGTTAIKTLTQTFTAHAELRHELRLGSVRPLGPIRDVRVSGGGSTDYDHDVNCQRVLGQLLASPSADVTLPIRLEPRIHLGVDRDRTPWRFTRIPHDQDAHIGYQPDAIFYQTSASGMVTVNVVEYERHQTRRDAWSHLQRMLGYVYLHVHPHTSVHTRFIVDRRSREQSYVDLIEAFADHLIDTPDWSVTHTVAVSVSSRERLRTTGDRLAAWHWSTVTLPAATSDAAPVMHNPAVSMYNNYFTKD